MRGIAILILIVVFICLIWPRISRWLANKAMEKMEDRMRSAMGMPPRYKKRKGETSGSAGRSYYERSYSRNQRKGYNEPEGPIIPKEYAEDVEFVEIREYSSSKICENQEGKKTKVYHESQISDAEWVEIKKSRSK